MTSAAWASAVVGAVGVILVAIITWLSTRKRTDAETADLITQAADRIIRRLETDLSAADVRVQRLVDQFSQAQVELTELRHEVRSLRNLVVELGHGDRLAGLEPSVTTTTEATVTVTETEVT